MARVQWHAQQKRLEKDNQLKQRYMTTIFDDMDKGYIAAVTNQDAKNICYLPHHPVINKQKPDKIRRVTNAASKYKGVSLNDALLTGPDVLCTLHGLLLRFRQYKVAVTADIEAMFMQVGIREEDQDALRFFFGATMRGHPNTNDSFLEQHVLLPAQFLFCKSAPTITDKNIQKSLTQSQNNSTWMTSFKHSQQRKRQQIQRLS